MIKSFCSGILQISILSQVVIVIQEFADAMNSMLE